MSDFARLRAAFRVNWTTILVGWSGLGIFSPWPSRWAEFPPLLSGDEVSAYADERLASTPGLTERDLIVELLSLDPQTESRETVKSVLSRLSALDRGDQAIELRKWRLVLLEQVLEEVPQDAVYGLTALSEFWQGFGFPSDSPHEVQGRGNTVIPSEYYQQENLRQLLATHHSWINQEKAAIKMQTVVGG